MLNYVFVTLNQIEESYMYGKVTADIAAERLRGVLILLDNMLREEDDTALPKYTIEREIRGAQYLIGLYDAVKEEQHEKG